MSLRAPLLDAASKAYPAKRFALGLTGLCRLLVAGAVLMGLATLAGARAVPAQAISPQAAQAMQQGGVSMTSGDFAAAAAAYSSVTQILPGFAEGYLNLGLASFQAGQLDDAGKALKKALQLKATLRGANLFLGIIAYRQNRFKEAETLLQRETHLDPQSAKANLWLGISRLAEDNPIGAIAPLDKAYALDPKDIDVLYQRGRAYYLVANASYAAMFAVDRDSVRVHQVLADAYAEANRNHEAIGELEIAVKMAPRQPGLHEELADQYWVVGDLDKASAAYREELGIDPYATASMYKLGSLLVLNQKQTEGVGLLRQALAADPGLSDAHYYLGDGLMGLGEFGDAAHEFDQAIAADPANDRAMSSYYKLAQTYRKLNDQQQAQVAMQNFLRMRSERKAQSDTFAANIAHKRTELPVTDSERASMMADTP